MSKPYAAGDPFPFCAKEGKEGKLYPTGSREVQEPATLPKSGQAKAEFTEFECDTCHRGENVRNDMVDSSTRKSGKKNSKRKIIGAGGMGGYILFRTIRSKGSSKIIGADAAPTKALNNTTLNPCLLVKSRMMTNVAAAHVLVTGLTGLGAVYGTALRPPKRGI